MRLHADVAREGGVRIHDKFEEVFDPPGVDLGRQLDVSASGSWKIVDRTGHRDARVIERGIDRFENRGSV